MKLTFRWYGEKDCIPLNYIKQIQGMTGVVTAVYDVPVGEVWEIEKLERLKSLCNNAGLEMEVIESIPVHEDIKLGRPTRDKLIANYAQNIINCGKIGVKCVCYNFMPVFDWFRTNLRYEHADGSNSLSYSEADFKKLDRNNLRLPGWDESYTQGELGALIAAYDGMTHERLFDNLVYFLNGIMPACREAGVNMAIHPDDPPWDIFGLPRIIKNIDDIRRFLNLVDSPYNGLTFCTGSLGASTDNDLPAMIREVGDRIYFAHLRNVKIKDRRFNETSHLSSDGSLDMYEIVKALQEVGFDGYVRPDHGRMIWGEVARPGYGLYDRALGCAYLNGLWEAVAKNKKTE